MNLPNVTFWAAGRFSIADPPGSNFFPVPVYLINVFHQCLHSTVYQTNNLSGVITAMDHFTSTRIFLCMELCS